MTLADLLAEMRREAETVAAVGAPFTEASIAKARERVAVLERAVRLPVIPACGICEHCKPDLAGEVYCEDSPDDVLDPRVVAQDEPPAWCPLRGAP